MPGSDCPRRTKPRTLLSVVGLLVWLLYSAPDAVGEVFHISCKVIVEDRAAPSWFGWGDALSQAAAIDAAIRAACDPAPVEERELCRSRARTGRISLSFRRSASRSRPERASTRTFAEIEIYRPNARIEALGHAWGPAGWATSATSEGSKTGQQACYRALELACALIKARPESQTYPLGEDKNALACHGKSWQIVEHQEDGANPNQEGAKFVPEAPKTAPVKMPSSLRPE